MTTKTVQGSARIYQFPAGKRMAPGDRSHAAGSTDVPASAPVASGDCGSGWYHDAAIKDARKPRKP